MDQAEYLNSALLMGGNWDCWPRPVGGVEALLIFSKIPPLSSMISGGLMGLVGESSDQAGWILSFWHAVLLLTVASWGRCIGGRRLGLLAALFLAVAPGLAEHRVKFTLELPLTSATTLALFLLYLWRGPVHVRPMDSGDRCCSSNYLINLSSRAPCSWWSFPPPGPVSKL